MNTSTDIARALYAAFGNKDEAALRAVLHPDVVWLQCPGFPGGGQRKGADEVVTKVFYGLNDQWRDFAVHIDSYLDAGGQVVVLGRYSGAHADTGKTMESQFAHIYEIDAGRVTHFRQIADTYPMVAAMG